MKSIIKTMLEDIYITADKIAKLQMQVAEQEKIRGDFFITLEQLEQILKEYEG